MDIPLCRKHNMWHEKQDVQKRFAKTVYHRNIVNLRNAFMLRKQTGNISGSYFPIYDLSESDVYGKATMEQMASFCSQFPWFCNSVGTASLYSSNKVYA